MKIVSVLITANGVHIGIKPFARLKAVSAERLPLPFCQRLDYLDLAVIVLHIKRHRTFNAVESIVKAGVRAHKKRCGNAGQVQLNGKITLKKILNLFNRDLSLPDIEQRTVPGGNKT